MDLYTGEQPPPLAQSFLMGVWGVGANQSSPSTYAGALPPLQHRPPNPTQTGWVFAVGLQKPANLVVFGESGRQGGWRQTRRRHSSGTSLRAVPRFLNGAVW